MQKIAIAEIFENLPEEFDHDIDIESLCDALHIPASWDLLDEELEKRFKSYGIVRWLCTDTWVGTNIITFDDKPFAITHQSARKNPIHWAFFSVELAEEVRTLLLPDLSDLPIQDPNLAIPAHYNVGYGAELLEYEGFHEERAARVVKIWDYGGLSFPARDGRPERAVAIGKMDRIVIRYHDTGEEKEIECCQFYLPLRLKGQS